MNEQPKLSIRSRDGNENHHLWNNNGTWWCHWTVHLPGFLKKRHRSSLGTKDLGQARRRRDALLQGYPLTNSWRGGELNER
jgi:hypothetical protein